MRRYLLALCLAAAPAAASAQPLTHAVVPEHYDLSFAIDLANARFDGRAGIDVRVTRTTNVLTLHALEIDIDSASVTAAGTTQTARVTTNADAQTVTLTVPNLVTGKARLDFVYSAPLNDKLRGLYLSKANDRSYAVTQFESTDARRAFPGFDDPEFKATFAVTVTADKGDVAISNGRMLSDTPGPGPNQHTMKFSTTAKMSSYLVAIAVGDFQCLEGKSEGVPIRICATPDKKELGHIALESAQKVLTYLNRYHTIKYPFGKLDVVAVPDFAAGAMENAGAIFYRETDLLADAKTASLTTRKTIFGVLAHEMAHQWFGDLVTMQWWDDIWLNEGFATWMATRPAADANPAWHMELDEAAEIQQAINLDSLKSTHPLHATVQTPGEIEGAFDPIAYEKGASVVRMVEAYVGDEPFRKGVNAYLEKYKYANATSEDFMSAIAAASGKPVDRIMGTFVLQAGVPQVDVTSSCANGRTSVTLAQSRFSVDSASASPGSERWQIPICLKAPGAASPTCAVLTEPTQTVPIGGGCSPWVFANAGGKGYYRTVYTPEALKAMAKDVATALDAAERYSLVSDEWALVRSGRHSVANYLDLVSGFGRETMAPVLSVVTDRLATIDETLTTASNRGAFRAFVGTLLRPAYESIGFDRAPSDSEDRRTLRNVIVSALGSIAEDPGVIGAARANVDAALEGKAPLDPILATTLVDLAAAHGDAKFFDALMNAAKAAKSPDEHYRYLYALTAFRDPALIRRALDYTLSPELRSQDAALYLASFFAKDAAEPAWAYIKEHWTQLEAKITISLGDVTLINNLAAFCSAEKRDDVKSFFATRPLPAAGRTLQQTLERIDNCVAVKQRQQPALATWLAGR